MKLPGFAQLGVSSKIFECLKKQGIKLPMPVQASAIPALYAGKDVIMRAQTGTGKTLAFCIPLVEKIDLAKDYVQGLIITPTRELAQQTVAEIKKISADKPLKVLGVTGGRNFDIQKNKLNGNTHVLVGTTGRILDHIRKKNTNLGGVKYLVLDEVDEILEQGFIDETAELISMCNDIHQTVLCSATLNEEVRKLGKRLTTECVVIDIDPHEATVRAIEQYAIKVVEEKKIELLAKIIERENPYLMIVFCYSKERTNKLGDLLSEQGYNCDVLHGEMSAARRKTVMKRFRDASLQILVASDIAARGLDVEGVTHVVNYDIPHDEEWYVHRIGRTGRAGKDGIAITFYTPDEIRFLNNIESKLKIKLNRNYVVDK